MSPFREDRKPTILVVDDDPSGLSFFRLSLKRLNYRVLTAQSVREAQSKIRGEGIDKIDCILTDVRMPIQSGLDLLEWVMREDDSLSTIIVTAQGEKNLVRDSLRGGASDFLEKPVNRKTLAEAVSRGVVDTERSRQLRATDEEVKAVGRMEQIFQVVRAPEIAPFLRYYSRPLYEVGGDFINVLPMGENRCVFIIGDVSGHDVRAAFVSAYFQGMVRGLLEHEASLEEIFHSFNRTLSDEWAPTDGNDGSSGIKIQVSLAVCAGMVDLRKNSISLLSCGFPPYLICYKDGRCAFSKIQNPPLGWFALDRLYEEVPLLEGGDFLCVATDGLTEYAAHLEIDSCSLIYKLLAPKGQTRDQFVIHPPDDILVMGIQLDRSAKADDLFQPLIYEQYSGEEISNVDRLQGLWRRSLQYAISEELEDRIYDLLLCCREAVINGLVYGCDESSEKMCTLQITFSPGLGIVRVRVDDPGHGHRFDLSERLMRLDPTDGTHLGLAIIQNLSDTFEVKNDGATVVFEFQLRNE